MRNPVPPIREDEATLKERLQREHDGQRKPRLQMLYLLVTRQAQDRQDVARLLGVHRNTIGRWLARYAAGGVDALLATYIPPGQPLSLTPAVLASLEQALRRPKASPRLKRYGNGCDRRMGWRSSTKRFTPWCACASRPSSKWPDRVTPKNPEAIPGRFPDDLWGTPAGSHPARECPPVACAAKTKAALASSPSGAGASPRVGGSLLEPSSMSSSGSMSMAPWRPPRATGSFSSCPI